MKKSSSQLRADKLLDKLSKARIEFYRGIATSTDFRVTATLYPLRWVTEPRIQNQEDKNLFARY